MIIKDCILDLKSSIGAEPAATPWDDLSRYKNDGVITTGTGGWVQLFSGLWVLEYDGTATEVVAAASPSLNITTGDFSFTAWAYLDTTGSHRVFCGGSTLNAPHLFSRNNEAILLSKPSAANAAAANTSMVTDSWQFIACAFDNSAVTNNLFYYRNGVADGIVTFNHDFADYMNSIGVGNNAASWHWDGKMGLVSIYNYVLSPSDMWTKYNKERGWFSL